MRKPNFPRRMMLHFSPMIQFGALCWIILMALFWFGGGFEVMK